MNIVFAVVVVTIIGLIGAAILVVASQFLKVEVDPRVELVQDALPGVNCGACGYAGCADYSEAVVDGEKVSLCVPGGPDTAGAVASIMGEEAGAVLQRMAVVACQGSLSHVTEKYEYSGVETCRASAALHGGASSCPYGCLGYGDCAVACPYDAIVVQDGLARVIQEKCTGCGACEPTCPKKLLWIREVSDKPVVLCANHQRGALTRKACTAGCISCMKCEKACPEDAIHVKDNVARIDLAKCTSCGKCVEVCPVDVIAMPRPASKSATA